ncbi:MAG: hypothetical protein LBI44_02195 [Oscillospiraceae bacterium]|jgi:uncharacterized coiled-coil protein SlyX|nr:hypothetical protein [Oscillospiraceae bacterium]
MSGLDWIILACALAAAAGVLWFALSRFTARRLAALNPSSEREAKIFRLYREIESLLDSFDQYVAEVHAEIEDERAALAELSRRASVIYLSTLSEPPAAAPPPPTPSPAVRPFPLHVLPPDASTFNAVTPDDIPPPRPAPADAPPRLQEVPPPAPAPAEPKHSSLLAEKDREQMNKLTTKAQKVRFLMSRGIPADEAARELNIGIGEIRLIADLSKG